MRPRPAFLLALAAALTGGAAPAPSKPAAPATGESAAPARSSGLSVRIGRGPGFSRIEFHGGAGSVVRQTEQELVLRFAKPGDPDLSRLRVDPPPLLEGASPKRTAGGLELTLALADAAAAKVSRTDGALAVILSEKGEDATAPEAAPERPDPSPPSGVVKVGAEVEGVAVSFAFPWAAPAPAAVFRRGEAVWVVFAARARLDASAAPRNLKTVKSVTAHQGEGWTALRIVAPPSVAATAVAEGARWTVTLGPTAVPPASVAVARDPENGAVLRAALAGAAAVHAVSDPVVGDRIAVVTALGPAKGAPSRREFVEFNLLPSAHGLALEPVADDLQVAVDGEHVRFGRPRGLRLSPDAGSAPRGAAPAHLPQRASLPGLIDAARWGALGEDGFLPRYDALLAAAAEESAKPDAPKEARLALARFLLGSDLPQEAHGVLNMLEREDGALLGDAEFRGLRGAARAMMGRWKEAEADFAAPVLAADPASALWRGLIAERLGDPEKAREAYAAGARALPLFAPAQRVRFERSAAEAALARGDVGAARLALAAAAAEPVDEREHRLTQLVQARLLELEGAADRALQVYDILAQDAYEGLAVPARLRAAQIRLAKGVLPPDKAAAQLNTLRWRWRGGETEMETVRALGRLHLSQGQYREGLAALRSVGVRLPDTPATAALQADAAAAFRNLFLEGGADGLEPIQALGLFYDFRDMTPIGADGDLMVRRLAGRLVDVDLLPQAAELLQHQAERRLDGVASAQVATDLALIHLMDRRPEDALSAIHASRTTLLPPALNAERRVLEARALAMLGRTEHALEVIANDASPDAMDIRAEIAWKENRWSDAAPALERALGDRWKRGGALTPAEENRLLRAGAAYSLAGDAAGVARLNGRYRALIEGARAPDALRVALAGGDGIGSDFARAAADADGFTAWVQAMKKRFREPATAASAPVKQAAGPAAAAS